jgi:hypothetical protein
VKKKSQMKRRVMKMRSLKMRRHWRVNLAIAPSNRMIACIHSWFLWYLYKSHVPQMCDCKATNAIINLMSPT